jgi:hypothetical protein
VVVELVYKSDILGAINNGASASMYLDVMLPQVLAWFGVLAPLLRRPVRRHHYYKLYLCLSL